MEAADSINPMWWIARQWMRFLTGLAILAVATASGYPAPVRSEPVRAASVQTVSADLVSAHADLFRTVHSGASFGLASVSVVEPAPALVAFAPLTAASPAASPVASDPTALRSLVPAFGWGSGQRPARLVGPGSADVSTAGMRAPPAVNCLLT